MIEERGSRNVKALANRIRREWRGCAGAMLGMCPMVDDDAPGTGTGTGAGTGDRVERWS